MTELSHRVVDWIVPAVRSSSSSNDVNLLCQLLFWYRFCWLVVFKSPELTDLKLFFLSSLGYWTQTGLEHKLYCCWIRLYSACFFDVRIVLIMAWFVVCITFIVSLWCVFVGHNDKKISYLLTYLLTYLLRVGTGIPGHRVNNFGREAGWRVRCTMPEVWPVFRALIRSFTALLHGCSE